MKRHLFALGAIAASLTIGGAAQTRVPQNDSITKEDLRADLFFLARDSMRGRLTDTEENRAAADFIRSHFGRMALKPAPQDTSYFETDNLMTATLPDGKTLKGPTGEGGARPA